MSKQADLFDGPRAQGTPLDAVPASELRPGNPKVPHLYRASNGYYVWNPITGAYVGRPGGGTYGDDRRAAGERMREIMEQMMAPRLARHIGVAQDTSRGLFGGVEAPPPPPGGLFGTRRNGPAPSLGDRTTFRAGTAHVTAELDRDRGTLRVRALRNDAAANHAPWLDPDSGWYGKAVVEVDRFTFLPLAESIRRAERSGDPTKINRAYARYDEFSRRRGELYADVAREKYASDAEMGANGAVFGMLAAYPAAPAAPPPRSRRALRNGPDAVYPGPIFVPPPTMWGVHTRQAASGGRWLHQYRWASPATNNQYIAVALSHGRDAPDRSAIWYAGVMYNGQPIWFYGLENKGRPCDVPMREAAHVCTMATAAGPLGQGIEGDPFVPLTASDVSSKIAALDRMEFYQQQEFGHPDSATFDNSRSSARRNGLADGGAPPPLWLFGR